MNELKGSNVHIRSESSSGVCQTKCSSIVSFRRVGRLRVQEVQRTNAVVKFHMRRMEKRRNNL